MQEIGTELKRLREQKGLTLEEVQQATKIRTRYLEAIEAGDLSALPGLVYARGFMKSYAEFLGINGQELLETHGLAVAPVETAPIEPVNRRAGATQKSLGRASVFGGTRVLPQILAGVGVLAVVAILYVVIVNLNGNRETSNDQAKTQTVPNAKVQQVAPIPAPQPTKTPVTPPPPQTVIAQTQKATNRTTYTVSGVQAMTMQVTTMDDAWLEVTADGKTVLSTIVKKGETHTWNAHNSLTLLTAKSPYLTVKINDQPIQLEKLLRGYTYAFQIKS